MTNRLTILDEYKTIKKIKDGFSLSRYGDGEFFNFIRLSKSINKMQKFDSDLQDKLLTIFTNPIDKLLVGIPRMNKPKSWVSNFHRKFFKFLKVKGIQKNEYVSAFVSRPSLVGLACNKYFMEIESIWKEKKIVLINFNRNLLNHDLFKDYDIEFIDVSRRNCFSEYSQLRKKCKKLYNKNRIFLVSAGPTATILSYDLTVDGEQCLDIGQIAFEYSLFKNESNIENWTSQGEFRKGK